MWQMCQHIAHCIAYAVCSRVYDDGGAIARTGHRNQEKEKYGPHLYTLVRMATAPYGDRFATELHALDQRLALVEAALQPRPRSQSSGIFRDMGVGFGIVACVWFMVFLFVLSFSS